MRLHADDLGLNNNVNKYVKLLLKQKQIHSVSILANGNATRNACKILKSYGYITVFLHFNLIEGRPVSNPAHVKTLVDKSGHFYNRNRLIYKLLINQVHLDHIKHELRSQLERLKNHGVKVVGIDSHQHMHALSPIAEIVDRVAKENGINKIRSYCQMRTQTVFGKVKFSMYKILAFLSFISEKKKIGLPVFWINARWQNFFVCSWEKVNINKVGLNHIVIVHPGLPYDQNYTI